MVMKSAIAAGVMMFAASPVLAGDTQPYQHGVTQFAYEGGGANYCPAGLQPIRYNGVICCGEPNATGYSEAPAVKRKRVAAKSPSYAPERIPLGKSPGSFDGT